MDDAPDDADEVTAVEFADYMRAQYPDLIGFATILTGKPWLAEDLVNDVLGKAFEHWPRISDVDHPHAYVRRMVLNAFIDRRRRFRLTRPVADPADYDQPVPSVEAAHAERDEMRTRLAALPRKQQAALVLRYYLELSDAEIAVELGCQEATVRSHIFRGLRALRINPTDHDPPTPTGEQPHRRRRPGREQPDPTAVSLAELFEPSEPVTE